MPNDRLCGTLSYVGGVRFWGAAALVVIVFVASLYLSCRYRHLHQWSETQVQQMAFAERKERARRLYFVLSQYAEGSGKLPYSVDGASSALYKLRAIADVTFEFPSVAGDRMALPLGERAFGDIFLGAPASYDDKGMRVVGCSFDYLNEAVAVDRTQPAFAIYAERVLPGMKGRWVVFCNGAMLWVPRRSKGFVAPLGESWRELNSGYPPPERRVAHMPAVESALSTQRQRVVLCLAFASYRAAHNGDLPYAVKGGDYALYELRPYVSDARVFDVPFSQLENGVAYFNHKENRVDNADVVYSNDPKTADGEREPVVILAEKWGVSSCNLRFVLLSDGTTEWLQRGWQNAEAPLGKTLDELETWRDHQLEMGESTVP